MNPSIPAKLVLENGIIVTGTSFGALVDTFGEIVFNTSMTGYQEILTDPSYYGQTIVFTYPHIGNYGINEEDVESSKSQIMGMVVREVSKVVSNFRATDSLQNYLKKNGIPGIEGVDTRYLTLNIRDEGAMRCLITHDMTASDEDLIQKVKQAPQMDGADLAKIVSVKEKYVYKTDQIDSGFIGHINQQPFHVVAIDYGIKRNILRILNQLNCKVTVLPCQATFAEIMALHPDGIFLSNGPGDPAAVTYTIPVIKQLIESGIPVFGICLGHQLSALALGAKTFKMKFGHRGANHPIKHLATNKIEVTAQNHGFAVSPDIIPTDVEVTHINLNDQTIAGIKHKKLPFFSIQYHPESSPGPHDSHYLFEHFMSLMKTYKQAESIS